LYEKDDDQVLAFRRGDLIFVFNWSPNKSFTDYGFLAPAGEYELILDSDSPEFGGFGSLDKSVHHFTMPDPLFNPMGKGWLKLYIPARTAQVLRMVRPKKHSKAAVHTATKAKSGSSVKGSKKQSKK
ncbi:MAG: alpha amylase C-terminal domain-containing protein, partial [Muribaculaceae bacterium]|nr:alpha amylase C-terminal domain-containing protein [Muribaculaceae bacterium]